MKYLILGTNHQDLDFYYSHHKLCNLRPFPQRLHFLDLLCSIVASLLLFLLHHLHQYLSLHHHLPNSNALHQFLSPYWLVEGEVEVEEELEEELPTEKESSLKLALKMITRMLGLKLRKKAVTES